MGLAYLLIHIFAVAAILRMSLKRGANMHLWVALACCWGPLLIPYFMLVTSDKQSKVAIFKRVQNSVILIYVHCGAAFGILVGIHNLFAFAATGNSDAFLYLVMFYGPSYILALPWSLVSIFLHDSLDVKILVVTIGAILNGSLIGLAYGALRCNKSVHDLAMD